VELERTRESLGDAVKRPRTGSSRAWPLLDPEQVEGAKWDQDSLRHVAFEIDGADSQLRLLLADVLKASRGDLLSAMPVTDSARQWYSSLLHAAKGDAESALEALSLLPANGYPGRLVVVLRGGRVGLDS
jgi:hypothetical protein